MESRQHWQGDLNEFLQTVQGEEITYGPAEIASGSEAFMALEMERLK